MVVLGEERVLEKGSLLEKGSVMERDLSWKGIPAGKRICHGKGSQLEKESLLAHNGVWISPSVFWTCSIPSAFPLQFPVHSQCIPSRAVPALGTSIPAAESRARTTIEPFIFRAFPSPALSPASSRV